jgi:hypothetical protein
MIIIIVTAVETSNLTGRRFISDDDAKTPVQRWFHAQLAEFYNSGISKLVRWDKCLNWVGDYVEK